MQVKTDNKKTRGKAIKLEAVKTPFSPKEIEQANRLARRVGLALLNMLNAKQN